MKKLLQITTERRCETYNHIENQRRQIEMVDFNYLTYNRRNSNLMLLTKWPKLNVFNTVWNCVSILIIFASSVFSLVAQDIDPFHGTPEYWKAESKIEMKKVHENKKNSLKAEFDRYLLICDDIGNEKFPYAKESVKINTEVKRFLKNINKIELVFQIQRTETHEKYMGLIEDAKKIIARKSPIGNWSWFNGGKVTLNEKGQILWGGNPVGIYTTSGITCSLKWNNKNIDILNLSRNGLFLDGRNKNGDRVWGTRIE
jgi:hypothetical protein